MIFIMIFVLVFYNLFSLVMNVVEICFLTKYGFIQKKLGGSKKLITSFR